MNITIRKAILSDIKTIQKLNLLLFKKEHKEYDKLLNLNWTFSKTGTAYFKKRISGKSECAFVAVLDNTIIGYLVGSITKVESYRNLPLTAELDNMLILEKHRSKGIGKLLYTEFISWCKLKKVKMIRVQASARNIKAIEFYRKIGFKDYTLVLESNID
jgi:ribosomal protein S18 acetylase RimI-like enzyme